MNNLINELTIIDDFKISSEERLEAAKVIAKNFQPDLKTICEIDLHCHSFYSDGYYSPTNKVFEAYRRKIKAIAISDHDTFDGQLEAISAGKIFNIEIIPAIEFYTDRPGVEIIIHFFNEDAFIKLMHSKITDKIILPIKNAKEKQLNSMLKRIPDAFKKVNFDAIITQDDIDKFLRNGISTKGDISVAMWQKYGNKLFERKLSEDVKDFHAKYTTKDEILNVPLNIDLDLSPKTFIKYALEWGGVPGLAHPTELRNKENIQNCEFRKILENLAAAGLQTLEVDGWRNTICPETGLHQTELFEKIRTSYNLMHPSQTLLFTNGSDDHNQPGEGLELGCGKNNNLNPAFGTYKNIKILRDRSKQLHNHYSK